MFNMAMVNIRVYWVLGACRDDSEFKADLVAVSTNAHEEVVGLDVAMDKVLDMDVFDPTDHLQWRRRR